MLRHAISLHKRIDVRTYFCQDFYMSTQTAKSEPTVQTRTVRSYKGVYGRAFLYCPFGHEVASSPVGKRTATAWLAGDFSDESCGHGACKWGK